MLSGNQASLSRRVLFNCRIFNIIIVVSWNSFWQTIPSTAQSAIREVSATFRISLRFTVTQRAVSWSTNVLWKTSTWVHSSRLQWPAASTALAASDSQNSSQETSRSVKSHVEKETKSQLMLSPWSTMNFLEMSSIFALLARWTICHIVSRPVLGS